MPAICPVWVLFEETGRAWSERGAGRVWSRVWSGARVLGLTRLHVVGTGPYARLCASIYIALVMRCAGWVGVGANGWVVVGGGGVQPARRAGSGFWRGWVAQGEGGDMPGQGVRRRQRNPARLWPPAPAPCVACRDLSALMRLVRRRVFEPHRFETDERRRVEGILAMSGAVEQRDDD